MSVRKRKWMTRAGVEKEAWIVDYADQQGTRRLKTFKRKKDADAFASSTHVEVREGTHVADRATVTVKEAAENWIKSGEAAELEKATLAQYRQHVDLHIVPFIGRTKISQLSVSVVRAFQDRLREEGRSAAMVKRVTGSLGSILADAHDRGLVTRNAVREMARRQPRGKQRQGERRRKARLQPGVDIPTPAEIAAMLHAVKGRWRSLLIAAVYTGLRASELRGLRWSDVDLAEGKIHVRQRADRYHVIGMPKSDAGQRTIPIGPFVVNTLKEWKLACPKGDLDLVFPTGAGAVEGHPNIIRRGLIPPQMAAGITTPVLDEAGKSKLDDKGTPIVQAKYTGLHALRHFFASWCINRRQDGGRELPPKTVQHLMGHSSITMTMDTYGHLFPASDDGKALAEAETALLRAV
jgi:integrase